MALKFGSVWRNGKTLKIDYVPESSPPWWISILPTLGLIVIFVLFWVFFLQQSQGGGGNKVMSFGKSRARMSDEKDKKVNAKGELRNPSAACI